MKRAIRYLLCLILILSLAGCGGNEAARKAGNQPAGVKDILEQAKAASEKQGSSLPAEQGTTAATPAGKNTTESPDDGEPVDVDLTALSGALVLSEVTNMLSSPKNYIGKTVKMRGSFASFPNPVTGGYYFTCMIQDAAACCAQGMEFILAGDLTYPDDYPPVKSIICVIGVFDTYQEGGNTYCTLRDARLIG